MKSFLIFLALLQLTTATVYLTKDDFASQTEGKKALVAFKAPWCGVSSFSIPLHFPISY